MASSDRPEPLTLRRRSRRGDHECQPDHEDESDPLQQNPPVGALEPVHGPQPLCDREEEHPGPDPPGGRNRIAAPEHIDANEHSEQESDRVTLDRHLGPPRGLWSALDEAPGDRRRVECIVEASNRTDAEHADHGGERIADQRESGEGEDDP